MTVFHLLFVCTGNMYRSPIAERLLPLHLGPAADGFRIGSAGTMARPGTPMSPDSVTMIEGLGGQASGFATRRLSAELIGSADLVLGLAREHREAAVQLLPTALRRCFTLEEFVRLTRERSVVNGPRAAVAQAAVARGRTSPAAPGADDIEDPDGRPLAELRDCAARIDQALRHVAAALTAGQDLLLSG
ncbi:low molecular weight phosphatase family protein [Streptomyces camelliae]|uniref:Low molecular weight phosphatase family protein n=1 Tax=Streptomyces camelliae TaxID=3004093 RepID=A0ABY7P4K2_9ACTN|nr:low molecular weight phosphatase family protein [Streptomyces sp. HUAS 2-6]WBO64904.1 low molecular weight phosphatase family protein [Streptomyces sp. HUAS 2-6]